MSLTLKSPAKLNLFLHITGRRQDGYHLIQSIFQLIDAYDELTFTANTQATINLKVDSKIVLTSKIEDNLVFKAAKLLQPFAQTNSGVSIHLTKHLPVGGGIGAGSANAATTLMALNHLWQIGLSKKQLMQHALTLGADVPFFIQGYSSWVEGIGEKITQLPSFVYKQIMPTNTFVCLLTPDVHVSTQTIFQNENLERNKPSVCIDDVVQPCIQNEMHEQKNLCNVFEPIVTQINPSIKEALLYLQSIPKQQLHTLFTPRMTGTGACVFALFNNKNDAEIALQNAPCAGLITKAVYQSEISSFFEQIS